MNWCSRALKLILVFSLSTGHQFAYSQLRCMDLITEAPQAWHSIPAPKAWSYLYEFKNFFEVTKQAESTKGSNLNDAKFLQLLKSIVLGRYTEITNSEWRSMSLNTSQQSIAMSLLKLRGSAEKTSSQLLYLATYANGRLTSPMIHKEKSWTKKALLSMQAIYNGPVRLLFPFVLLPKQYSPVNRILEKKFFNPEYQPSKQEFDTLRKYNAYETYLRNEYVQTKNPNWSTFRRMMYYGYVSALMVNTALLANWAIHLFDDDSFVNTDTFLSEPKHRLKENQVRIYNETVPFPHMAIEMDGKVYSYGFTHLNVSSTFEYLSSDEIHRALQRAIPMEEVKRNEAPVGSIQKFRNLFDLQQIANLTGLSETRRVVQMVTLNLKLEEKEKLKRFLQMSVHQKYRNKTLVMDCASMIAIALKNSTSVTTPTLAGGLTLDASPSLMMLHFGVLKSLGIKNQNNEDLIGNIVQVSRAPEDEKTRLVIRNLYINAMEAKIYMLYFGYNAAQRTYMHLRYGEDEFQFLEPEVREVLLKLQENVQQELTDINSENEIATQVLAFLNEAREIAALGADPNSDMVNSRYENLMKVSQFYFDQEISKARDRAHSTDSTLQDVVISGYREQVLLAFQKHIKNVAEGRASYLKIENPEKTLNRLLQK